MTMSSSAIRALLFAVLLSPVASAQEASAPRRFAIWTRPVGMSLAAFGGPLVLPLGVTLPVNDRTVHLEATWVSSSASRCPDCGDYWQLWFSAGSVLPESEVSLNGFFFHPHLLGAISNDAGAPIDTLPDGSRVGHLAGLGAELDVGVDAGYQLTVGPLYLAASLGGSAGYCFNCGATGPTMLLGPAMWGGSLTRGNRFVWSPGLNLLRVGGAF